MCGNADGVSKLQKYFPSTNLSEGSRILQTKIFHNHFCGSLEIQFFQRQFQSFFLMLRLSKTSKNYPIKYLTTFEAIYFVLGLQKVLPNTPKARVTNSSCPPVNLKGKENPDWPLVCPNYCLLSWLILCFNHLVLLTFQQCRSPIPQRSAKTIASIHHTVQFP